MGKDIVADNDGSIYICGSTRGPLNDEKNMGYDDIFLLKLSSFLGTTIFTKVIGSSAWDIGLSLALNSKADVFITGSSDGNLDNRGNAGGYGDIVLIKYSSSGKKRYTLLSGSSSDDKGTSISIDSNDNIYITGSVDGTIDGQLYTSDKLGDIFLMKYKELPSSLLSSSSSSSELSNSCIAS